MYIIRQIVTVHKFLIKIIFSNPQRFARLLKTKILPIFIYLIGVLTFEQFHQETINGKDFMSLLLF